MVLSPLFGWLADKHSRWAIIATGAKSEVQATAFAVAIFIMHAFGDAISPPLIGAVADRWNLEIGFLVVSFMMLVAGFSLAGGREISRSRCGESCLPLKNFAGCASILGVLIWFVCS
jgi:fucose permease